MMTLRDYLSARIAVCVDCEQCAGNGVINGVVCIYCAGVRTVHRTVMLSEVFAAHEEAVRTLSNDLYAHVYPARAEGLLIPTPAPAEFVIGGCEEVGCEAAAKVGSIFCAVHDPFAGEVKTGAATGHSE